MKRGIHTIRSGFTEDHNPTIPRRYSLDNGNFELNQQLVAFEIFPIGTKQLARDQINSEPVFFIIATDEAGATPVTGSVSEQEYGDVLNLRPSDSRQIAWGISSPAYGYVYTLIDPDHIIPNDIYINAYSISSGGTITQLAGNTGFMLKMEQKKNSGSEALLYQAKESALDD